MKTILLIPIVFLIACGGAEQEDPAWIQSYDSCESGGGHAKVYFVEDMETGSTHVEIGCVLGDSNAKES